MDEKRFIRLPGPQDSGLIEAEDIVAVNVTNRGIRFSILDESVNYYRFSRSKAEKLLSHEYLVRRRRSEISNSLKRKERNRKQSLIRLPNGKLVPVSDTFKEKLESVLKKFCYERE